MPTAISPGEVRKWIEQAMAQQPDIGLKKAVADILLQAHSPFDPQARRKPRVGFVLGAIFFAAAVICFYCFNLTG